MASRLPPRSALAFRTNSDNDRGKFRPRPLIRNPTVSSPSPLSVGTHRSTSPPSRYPSPLSRHTISPLPVRPQSRRPVIVPSPTSTHRLVHPQIAGPAPATCTNSLDDLADTSCPRV